MNDQQKEIGLRNKERNAKIKLNKNVILTKFFLQY